MGAFLADNVELIGALAGLVALVGAAFAALKWGGNVLARARRLAGQLGMDDVPRRTVRIVDDRPLPWWHMGSSADEAIMQVVSHWHVTNITDGPVNLLAARLAPTRLARPSIRGHVMTRHPKGDVYGQFPVLPGATSRIMADFWVKPPFRNEGEEFKATVVLVDQFGNDHKVKKVIFKYE